jgi:DNA-binding protein Fis
MKTNFFIVGGQRCGTTWLFNSLNQCPSIDLLKPIFPETKYFLNNNVSYDEYFSLFGAYRAEIFGEKATTYIESKDVAVKIKSMLPSAKIIICLRDPVQRAISNYFFSYNYGVETRTLEEVFLEDVSAPVYDVDKFSTNPFDYLQRGLYSEYLPNYLDVFPRDQVMITFMENFTTDVDEFYRITDWLGASRPRVKDTSAINKAKRVSEVSDDVINVLQKYYLADTQKLIDVYNLNPPYANTQT